MSEEVAAAERRRDHDEPVIPDRSADDEDVGWGDEDRFEATGGHVPGDSAGDDRLRRERPPHW